MSSLPLKERPFHAFISYAHKDYDAVSKIITWLRNFGGLNVWWDEISLQAAARIESNIPEGIRKSKNAIIFISKAAASSGWMRAEYGAILGERIQHHEYSIVTVKLDETPPPDLLANTKWVEVPNGELNEKNSLELLGGLYSSSSTPLSMSKDIYVSRGWRSTEVQAADKICRFIINAGFRLIGDSTDHKIFDDDVRIPSIMSSCGAVVIIAPARGNETSKFIIQEIEIAKDKKIPYLLIADTENLISQDLVSCSMEQRVFKTLDVIENPNLRNDLVDVLRENYRDPIKPHFSFYASSLLKNSDINEYVKRLMEQITGIRCLIGIQLEGQQAQKEIIKIISTCLFMLADISEGNNTLIESGVAMGAGKTLYIVCKGEPRPHMFMFRDKEISFYQNGIELLAIVHRIAYRYRRRVINVELQTDDWFGQ